jgi:hypothetical protein
MAMALALVLGSRFTSTETPASAAMSRDAAICSDVKGLFDSTSQPAGICVQP